MAVGLTLLILLSAIAGSALYLTTNSHRAWAQHFKKTLEAISMIGENVPPSEKKLLDRQNASIRNYINLDEAVHLAFYAAAIPDSTLGMKFDEFQAHRRSVALADEFIFLVSAKYKTKGLVDRPLGRMYCVVYDDVYGVFIPVLRDQMKTGTFANVMIPFIAVPGGKETIEDVGKEAWERIYSVFGDRQHGSIDDRIW